MDFNRYLPAIAVITFLALFPLAIALLARLLNWLDKRSMQRAEREDKDHSLFRYIYCWMFHRKYRKRTGTRRILSVSISYDIRCEKCGVEDIEKQWFLRLD